MRPLTLLATVLTLSLAAAVSAAPIPVAGMVRTAAGTPLADAAVELLPLPSNYEHGRMVLAGGTLPTPIATTHTDGAGRFTLAAPAAGMVTVLVRPAGFVPMRWAPLALVRPTELPPVTVVPDAGLRIAVRDRSGEPVAGVRILAESDPESPGKETSTQGWRRAARIATSAEDGRLVLPRAGDERVVIHAFVPGRTTAYRLAAGERATVVIEPPTGRPRGIEIGDQRGEPLAGVVVAAGDLIWPAGMTGGDGRLRVTGDGSRTVGLHLFAADGRHQREELAPARGTESGPVRFHLAPPRRISGRIVAAADRRPLAGVLVWPPQDPGTAVLTDARGAYELVVSPGERFFLLAEAAGFLPQRQRIHGANADAQHAPTLALTAAADAVGQVVDRDGTPLPGVRVEAVNLAPPGRDPLPCAVSDDGGRFVLRDLHPQAAYELTASRQGFSPTTVTISGPEVAAGERVRMVLEKARPGYGRVIDGDQRPLAGVEVTMVRSGARGGEPTTVWSDDEGLFTVAAVPGPKTDLRARKRGFAPLTVRGLERPPGEGPIDLGTVVLVPGTRIEGRVRSAGGEPIAGAEVRTTEARGRPRRREIDQIRRQRPVAVTDPRGRFAVEDLEPTRKVHLLVSAEGHLPAWVAGVEASDREALLVVLERASRLSGEVLGEDGSPIAGARVEVVGQGPPAGSMGVEPWHADVAKRTLTGPRGEFAIAELPPARVAVEVTAAGFQTPPPQEVEIPAGGAVDNLRFVLARGAVVEGRVATSDGEPVAGARVRVAESVAFADGDGIYRLEGVPLGRQALVAGHLEFERRVVMIEVEAGTNVVDLVLGGGWPVAGRVVEEGGAPLAGARVELLLDGNGEVRRYRATSAADGELTFPRVVDGAYDVTVDKDGYGAVDRPRGLVVDGAPVTDFEVVLRPGAVVAGCLLGLTFEELATAAVEAEQGERTQRTGTVDYQGNYEIRDLGPGVWRIAARVGDGSRQSEARVAIEPGDRRRQQDLEFGRGFTLHGSVSYGGARLPETSVTLRGLDVAVKRSVTTDHEGAFRIADLQPGRYRLDLANHRQSLLHNQDLTLAGDRELHLEIATASVAGKVVTATSSRPIDGALVFVQHLVGADAEPGSLISLPTDAQGGFVLGRLSAGRYHLRVRRDGYSPAEQWFEVAPGVAIDDLELALEPTEGLELMVGLAGGGAPNPVTVTVLDPSGRPLLREIRSVEADGYGRFPTVPAGRWDLLISAPGGAVTRVAATVPGAPLAVVLPAAARLRVQVPELVAANGFATLSLIGQAGRPFQGLDRSGAPRTQWPLAGGTGIVEGIPAGFWTLEAITADGRFFHGTVATAGGQEYDVVLE